MNRSSLDDRLRFDIAYMLAGISKSELNALKSENRIEKERVREVIVERIRKRLRAGFHIELPPERENFHSTSFGPPE